jgi:hypothetical protein
MKSAGKRLAKALENAACGIALDGETISEGTL